MDGHAREFAVGSSRTPPGAGKDSQRIAAVGARLQRGASSRPLTPSLLTSSLKYSVGERAGRATAAAPGAEAWAGKQVMMISRDPPQMGIPMSVGVETGIPLLAPLFNKWCV